MSNLINCSQYIPDGFLWNRTLFDPDRRSCFEIFLVYNRNIAKRYEQIALISDCYVKSLFQAQELVIVGMEAAFTAIFVENLESACLAERTMIQEQAS